MAAMVLQVHHQAVIRPTRRKATAHRFNTIRHHPTPKTSSHRWQRSLSDPRRNHSLISTLAITLQCLAMHLRQRNAILSLGRLLDNRHTRKVHPH